jgi:hypothetical protein
VCEVGPLFLTLERLWAGPVLQIFNMPVNLAQGTSVMYAYIIGFSAAPLTALQVRAAQQGLLPSASHQQSRRNSSPLTSLVASSFCTLCGSAAAGQPGRWPIPLGLTSRRPTTTP